MSRIIVTGGAGRLGRRTGNLEQAGRHGGDGHAAIACRADEPMARMRGKARNALPIDAAQFEMGDAPFEAELESRFRIAGHLVRNDADDHSDVSRLRVAEA